MFLDMGLVSVEEARALTAAAEPWIFDLLKSGEYKGWFLEEQGVVVTGGGLLLREVGPVAGCLRVGSAAHIVNVYTLLSHRKRGLARRILGEMLQWCAENRIDQVTLTSSEAGRGLYASLGFEPQMDSMRLVRGQ
ncbi:MAG: sortase-like acyltransferase [Acidobacteriaceae bacterium]|nr:sortase-like acyltransferase [Acidobacteriaceae bacterium]